jgi:sterol desaturase/sphingolipid hydroxylase (fatty acid hydroxylase superfamily)
VSVLSVDADARRARHDAIPKREEAPLTLVVLLGSLLAVALWEFCRPRRRRAFPALRRRLGNIGFWVLNLFLAALFFPSAAAVRPQLDAMSGSGLPSWPIADAGLGLVAGFLLLDLMRYAVHRCEHAVPLFWRFHALHYSDPDVDVTTSIRHHPIEYVAASAVYWLAVVVFDIPAVAMLSHGLAVFVLEAVQHGNIRLPERAERWLQPVLVTPDFHRIHHSASVGEANANYGAVLSIWDRLFGSSTRISRAAHDHIVFGIRDLPARACLRPLAMLRTPWLIPRNGAAD